jgi:hypothetical protein
MNDEIVARLEAERLRGMPRWNPQPAWEDEIRRRLQADAHAVDEQVMASHRRFQLVELHESSTATGALVTLTDGLTLETEGLSNAS